MVEIELVVSSFGALEGPERIFLGWERTLPRVAALLADHYGERDELRMSDAYVVLPGSRAGRRLKELLVDEAERRSARLVPPRIVTPAALADLLLRSPRPIAGEVLSRRAWAAALAGLPADRLLGLFREPPSPSDARGWGRLARIVARLHREVGGAGLRFADVRDRCGHGLAFADTERWSVLAEVQTRYEELLDGLALADRELARIDAVGAARGKRDAEGPIVSLDHDLWLAGVVEMPGVVREMLASLGEGARRMRVVVQAPAEEAGAFDALGCARVESWTERVIPLRDDQVAVRDRPGDQAEEVARALGGFGGRYAAGEIVIGAPDPEILPYLVRRLGSEGVAVHSPEGIPVERSRVARLLAALADYLDGGRFDACAALARHPDLWRWLEISRAFGGADEWLQPLDEYLNECLPARIQAPVNAGVRGAERVAALCVALDDTRLLGRMRGRRALSKWAPELLGLVAEVYAEPAPDRTDAADRRLIDACAAMRDVADELYRLPPALDAECDGATAIRILLDEAQGRALTPDPEAGAIEAVGWLELRLDDAPVAVVTGFNEPFLPQSVNADPFLPNSLRERLGLTDNAARYARDAYELTALLHSREEVRLIAGRRGASGDPLRPSRLFFAASGTVPAERVRRFYAEEGSARPPELSAVPGEGRFRMPPEPIIHAPETVRRLRVTDFRTLLTDPYRFALERVLGLDSLDDCARELDGLRFGSMAHEVLERFARSSEANSTDAAEVARRLDETLDALVLTRFGRGALPAVRVQTEQLRARLHAFARWQAERVADGWRVIGVECSTPEGGVPFDVDGEPIQITGRIDRIDFHAPTGRWALLDYKTGDKGMGPEDTHRAGKGSDRHWVDLQLPMYRHLLPHVVDRDGSRPFDSAPPGEVQLGYVVLSRQLDEICDDCPEWTAQELEEADEAAREVVRFLRRNEFRHDPAHAADYRGTPLGAVVGVGYLESAAGAEDTEVTE